MKTGTPINDASVWPAKDLGGRESWTQNLTPAMIDEVRAAIPRVGKTPPHLIRAADHPLPGLAGLLALVHDDSHEPNIAVARYWLHFAIQRTWTGTSWRKNSARATKPSMS